MFGRTPFRTLRGRPSTVYSRVKPGMWSRVLSSGYSVGIFRMTFDLERTFSSPLVVERRFRYCTVLYCKSYTIVYLYVIFLWEPDRVQSRVIGDEKIAVLFPRYEQILRLRLSLGPELTAAVDGHVCVAPRRRNPCPGVLFF